MLVEQIANKNQFKIFCKNGVAFQSYSSIIAFKDTTGKVYLSDKWDYSATTLKHLKLFLRISDTKSNILKKITDEVFSIVSEEDILKMSREK